MTDPRWWAAHGFGVFPCAGKVPRTGHGFHDAVTDPEAVDWTGNYGIVPKAGTWVLDVDGDEGKATLDRLEEEHGTLPQTLTVATGGGGLHLWFTGEVRQRARHLPGLDTRSAGKGYVVGPGSVHPETGRTYQVVLPEDIADPPAWLVELLNPPRVEPAPTRTRIGSESPDEGRARIAGMVRAAIGRIMTAPAPGPGTKGARNDTCNRECYTIGGYLDAAGVTVDDVAPDLERAVMAAEQDPALVRRALEDGRARRRDLPPSDRRDPVEEAREAWARHLDQAGDPWVADVSIGANGWGEPMALTADLIRADPPAQRFLVDWPEGRGGMLPRSTVGILASDGGLGKTRAMLELACCLADRRRIDWLAPTAHRAGVTRSGCPIPKDARGSRTLLLLAEERAPNVLRRIHWAVRDTGADPEAVARNVVVYPFGDRADLALTRPRLDTRTTVATDVVGLLDQAIERLGPFDLVVLDPLSAFASGETEVSPEAATKLFALLARLTGDEGPTILLTHHVTKQSTREGETGQGAIRGSSGLVNRARWAALLTPERPTVGNGTGANAGRPARFAVVKANDARRSGFDLAEDDAARGRFYLAPDPKPFDPLA